MGVNIAFLVIVAVSLIRTVSYGIYCMKRTVTGGISVFVLVLGIAFCGFVVWTTGIK